MGRHPQRRLGKNWLRDRRFEWGRFEYLRGGTSSSEGGTNSGCAIGDVSCICLDEGCSEGECREETGTCVLEVDGMVWAPDQIFFVGCDDAECPPESQPRRGMYDPC